MWQAEALERGRASRRSVLAALAAAAAAAATLSGCGFAPVGDEAMAIRRLALLGFDVQSPTAAALARVLPASVVLTPTPEGADAVMRVLRDRLDRTVVATTAAGEVRELRLRLSLRFQIEAPPPPPSAASAPVAAPIVWLPATDVEQSRDVSYTETMALAKDTEQRELIALMREDLARQLLRVLSKVPVPIMAPATIGASPHGAPAQPHAD